MQTGLSRFARYIILFINSMLLVRLLGPEGKGIQAIIITNVNLMSLVLGYNMLQTLSYYLTIGEDFGRKALNLGLQIYLFGILIAVTLFFVPDALSFILPSNLEFTKTQRIVYLLLFLNLFTMQFAQGVFQGTQKFKLFNKLTIFITIFELLILLLLFILIGREIIKVEKIEILLYWSLIKLCNMIIILVYIIFNLPYEPRLFSKTPKSIIYYSTFSYIFMVASFYNSKMNIWVIDAYFEKAQLGLYSLGLAIVDMLLMIYLSMFYTLVPKFTRKNSGELIKTIARLIVFISFFSSLILVLGSKYYIPFFYGKQYIGTIEPLNILLISFPFLAIYNYLTIYLLSSGKAKTNMYIALAGLPISTIFSFILIPIYGISGAASAYGIQFLALIIIQIISTDKRNFLEATTDLFILKSTDLSYLLKQCQNYYRNKKNSN